MRRAAALATMIASHTDPYPHAPAMLPGHGAPAAWLGQGSLAAALCILRVSPRPCHTAQVVGGAYLASEDQDSVKEKMGQQSFLGSKVVNLQ